MNYPFAHAMPYRTEFGNLGEKHSIPTRSFKRYNCPPTRTEQAKYHIVLDII
jgi:hypothetical protein